LKIIKVILSVESKKMMYLKTLICVLILCVVSKDTMVPKNPKVTSATQPAIKVPQASIQRCNTCKQISKNWWEGFSHAKQENIELTEEQTKEILDVMTDGTYTLASYVKAPGTGFCQDRNGDESRNRSYRLANCEENCSDDITCPGYSFDPVSFNCVWYTDFNPQSLGIARAADFAIFKADHPDDMDGWDHGECFVKIIDQKAEPVPMQGVAAELRKLFDDDIIYEYARGNSERGDFKYLICASMCDHELKELQLEAKRDAVARRKAFEESEKIFAESHQFRMDTYKGEL